MKLSNKMAINKTSYRKEAEAFLKLHYEKASDTTSLFRFRFIAMLAAEARNLAKASFLQGMDYQDAMTATWFSYTGSAVIQAGSNVERSGLLHDFFASVKYPAGHYSIVETAINCAIENRSARTKIQQVVSDAVNSQFSKPGFLEHIMLLKDEANQKTDTNQTELFYLQYYKLLFTQTYYYTAYANEHYTVQKEKNFKLLEKRVRKLEEAQLMTARGMAKANDIITNKETDDLFKIAFRNYNQLISVADSKASLLINVNSIIVSVMLAFVLSKVEHNLVLLWPTTLLLTVCMTTIFLSILASRPQKNILSKDRKSHSYQQFFFGSFDMTDPGFHRAGLDNYLNQLTGFFASSRETVYLELYKETFNVRKVLSKKFNYLAIAYWVFIIGLLISIAAFIIAIGIP